MRAITYSRMASRAIESVTNTAIAIRRPSGNGMSPISFVASPTAHSSLLPNIVLDDQRPHPRAHKRNEQIRHLLDLIRRAAPF
jgi:hypothetical protein